MNEVFNKLANRRKTLESLDTSGTGFTEASPNAQQQGDNIVSSSCEGAECVSRREECEKKKPG
jgi:hypothetical protein